MDLSFSLFFKKFYLPRKRRGIKALKSKSAVVQFFFESAINGDSLPENAPYSSDAFDSWYDGDNHPNPGFLSEIQSDFNEQKLSDSIFTSLADPTYKDIMADFGISLSLGELPDKKRFAAAVAAQFKALIDARLEDKDLVQCIIPAEYRKAPKLVGYDYYVSQARERYKWMLLPNEEECLLEENYVCNSLSVNQSVFKKNKTSGVLENATLYDLRHYDRRGETPHVVLVGSGGSGKTLFLQHLFVQAAERYRVTQLLPIFVEMRSFSYNREDIVGSIVSSVQEFDSAFSLENAITLLTNGQCQLLFDGLDELELEEVGIFQRKLQEFITRYPSNQVVITSRECDALKGIRQFTRLYMLPFDNAQSELLINHLVDGLVDPDDIEKVKFRILQFMLDGFIKKNGIFASNPLLLTVVVLNYDKLGAFFKEKTKFYDLVYRTVVCEHDKHKTSYARFFHSVADVDEFTEVFREFCAISYEEGVFEYTRTEFEYYFKRLTTPATLRNPHICTFNNFLHDACATACMMIEQDSGIIYIDPGFQEYFFADYYYLAPSDEVKEMGLRLCRVPASKFRGLSALEMLYGLSSDKVSLCLHLPYLDEIFRGRTEDEAFQDFLRLSYGVIEYSVMDSALFKKYYEEDEITNFTYPVSVTEPGNLLVLHMLRMFGVADAFEASSANEAYRINELDVYTYVGEIVLNKTDMKKYLSLHYFETSTLGSGEGNGNPGLYSRNFLKEGQSLQLFGKIYRLDLNDSSESQYASVVINMLKAEKSSVYKSFLRLQDYYKELTNKKYAFSA